MDCDCARQEMVRQANVIVNRDSHLVICLFNESWGSIACHIPKKVWVFAKIFLLPRLSEHLSTQDSIPQSCKREKYKPVAGVLAAVTHSIVILAAA